MSATTTAPGGDERTVVPASPNMPLSRLIPPGSPQPVHTALRKTDARTAMTRGLAEYASQLVLERPDGRELRFQKVFDNWAEAEDQAEYPSAIAYTTSPGVYEASGFNKLPTKSQRVPPPDNRYVMSPSELVITIIFEMWATDDPERMGLVAALEDGFNPFVGRGTYGFSLELPHYFNARASYEPIQVTYSDSEADAISRTRKAVFSLEARVPVIKLVAFPDAKPTAKVVAVGVDVVVNEDS